MKIVGERSSQVIEVETHDGNWIGEGKKPKEARFGGGDGCFGGRECVRARLEDMVKSRGSYRCHSAPLHVDHDGHHSHDRWRGSIHRQRQSCSYSGRAATRPLLDMLSVMSITLGLVGKRVVGLLE